MKRPVVLLFCLLLSATAWAEETFSVVTYNIDVRDRDLDEVVSRLLEANADLVCLQEVTSNAEAHLQASTLVDTYPYKAFILQPDDTPGGFGFLSKTPLENLDYAGPEQGRFGTWYAELELGGRTVHIANVHLQPTLPRRGDKKLDVMRRFLSLEGVRLEEIQEVHRRLDLRKASQPRMIIGDLNTLSSLPVIEFLNQDYIDSAAIHAHPDAHPTWIRDWKSKTWSFRFDYIFHSNAFETVENHVIEQNASDHHLVFATLRWLADP